VGRAFRPRLGDNRRVLLAIAAAALLAVGWELFAATTFIGDDHLFLTFARHAPSPLCPFFTDQHGGEYYRPVPMALWWLLARVGGGAPWPFAVAALLLHAGAALLAGALVRGAGRPPLTAVLTSALFLVAPGEREAALWFSASTDLLATTATLAAIVCLLRGGRLAVAASLPLAALAYLSKESALVLPLLAAACLAGRYGWRASLGRAAPAAAVGAAVVLARIAVLGGMGGTGDPPPALTARIVQIGAGVLRALVGQGPLPAVASLAVGAAALAWAVTAAGPARRTPLVWVAVAVLPLLAAGWVVGARYFYLPAVGLAWLTAEALAGRDRVLALGAVLGLLALGTVAALQRRSEVLDYRARLAAATDGVQAALAAHHPLVHVRCGIKDLDLALKEQPALRGRADGLLVLGDVPASFVLMPPALAARTAFLRASPPLPPSGAYRFGDRLVVGLARRQEAPPLDEVLRRLPELRFLELVGDGRGGITWRDVTE
jgi:hypothetical protein